MLNLKTVSRGFMKYEREKMAYRNPKTRQNDWNEIFDFKSVRKGLKKQAARLDKLSVPCHSTTWSCALKLFLIGYPNSREVKRHIQTSFV